jgi:hypothetical protein
MVRFRISGSSAAESSRYGPGVTTRNLREIRAETLTHLQSVAQNARGRASDFFFNLPAGALCIPVY